MALIACDEYADSLDMLSEKLRASYNKMRGSNLSSKNFDYSKIVVNRLRAFYCAQADVKSFLDKRVAQSGDDFFVETILFVLKLYCDIESLDLEFASERTIERKRKSIRPDISIWKGDALLGAIECKTQLGYQRNSWSDQYEDRERKIQTVFPEANLFLLVMTSGNWSGFGADLRVGKNFFCLLDRAWPAYISKDFDNSIILNPIEQLLEQVKTLGVQ